MASSFFGGLDKKFSIHPGDIVSVTQGRGWRRAKVLKNNDGILLVTFRDGGTATVSAEHVMTQAEIKQFRRTKGQTKIHRQTSPLATSNSKNQRGVQEIQPSSDFEDFEDVAPNNEPTSKNPLV